MKKLKTQNIWKAANVEFNQDEMIAHSYGWWSFVRIINGLVVFNHYPYSNTTIKHQYKVRRLLRELNIEIDIEVSTSHSLSHTDAIYDAVNRIENEITQIHAAMITGTTTKNQERAELIMRLRGQQEDIARNLHVELAA